MYIDNTDCLKHDVGFDDIKRLEDSLNNVASDLTLFENRTNENFTEVRQNLSDTKNDYNAHFITNLLNVNVVNANYAEVDMLNVKESHINKAFIDDLRLSSPVSDMTVTNLHVDNLDAIGGNFYNVNLKNVKVDVMNMTPIYTDDVLGYDDNGNLIPVHASYDIGLPNNADYISTDSDGTPIAMKNSIKVDPVNNLITSFGVFNEFQNLNNALDEKFNTIDNTFNDVNNSIGDVFNDVNNSFNDVNNVFNDVNNNISNIENTLDEVVIPSEIVNDWRYNENLGGLLIESENYYYSQSSNFYYDSKYIYRTESNNTLFDILYKNNHNHVLNLNLPLEVISPVFFTMNINGEFNNYWLTHYTRNSLKLLKNVTFSNLYNDFEFFTINNIIINEIRDSNFYLCRDDNFMPSHFPFDYKDNFNNYITDINTTFTHNVNIGLNNAKVVLTSPTLNKVNLRVTNTDVNRMSEVSIYSTQNFSLDYNTDFFGNETNGYTDETIESPISEEVFNHYINKNMYSIIYKNDTSFLYKNTDPSDEWYYLDKDRLVKATRILPEGFELYGYNYYKAELDELLFDLKQISGIQIQDMDYDSEFNGEIRLNSMVTDISKLLMDCYNFNQPINIPNNVVDMSSTFSGCLLFNQPINIPNNVVNIRMTFDRCWNFNQPINIPNNVVDMSYTFYRCFSFNQPINIPNSVVNMHSTFQWCNNFNQPINIPNNVVDMYRTFESCFSFNQPINIPNNVVNMHSTFENCYNFNQPINILNSVVDMSYTFYRCFSFNQPINIPNSVVNMHSTFQWCNNFNQPINIPNSVVDISHTFRNCSNFNSPINLYVTNDVDMKYAFLYCNNFSSPIHITSDHLLDASDNVYNQLTNNYVGKLIPSSLIFNDL